VIGGRILRVQRDWHGRSKIGKVEFQSMAMWHAMPWIFYLTWGSVPLALSLRPGPPAVVLGWTLIAVATLQCVHANLSLRRSLDHYLGRAELPRRDLAVAAAGMIVTLGLVIALQAVDGAKDGMLTLVTLFALVPYGQALAFAVPIRAFAIRFALIDAVTVAALAAVGVRGGQLLTTAVVIVFGGLVALLSSRCGAWTLSVMWEADRAREVESRLAVAEERLRFGRDLHDVMGRNLAVIALKSELAVQLARRGRPEAVDQMVEVQRIAQESQREVREVVRGYREIDLGVELAGAQGVLEAAGIACRVSGSSAGLSAPVQSALAWVVREAATNVLRHGDAKRCVITLAVADDRTTLSVENDGAPDIAPKSAGSGLAGLRERLSKVGGTLEFACVGGEFRLSAEVPTRPVVRDARPPEAVHSARPPEEEHGRDRGEHGRHQREHGRDQEEVAL
jgi:two-component system sensor histidine kinase DesK